MDESSYLLSDLMLGGLRWGERGWHLAKQGEPDRCLSTRESCKHRKDSRLMTTPTPTPTPTSRAVWIAIILLTAAFVAAGAGFLAYVGGAKPSNAILTGGGSFAAVVALLLALLTYATEGRKE